MKRFLALAALPVSALAQSPIAQFPQLVALQVVSAKTPAPSAGGRQLSTEQRAELRRQLSQFHAPGKGS